MLLLLLLLLLLDMVGPFTGISPFGCEGFSSFSDGWLSSFWIISECVFLRPSGLDVRTRTKYQFEFLVIVYTKMPDKTINQGYMHVRILIGFQVKRLQQLEMLAMLAKNFFEGQNSSWYFLLNSRRSQNGGNRGREKLYTGLQGDPKFAPPLGRRSPTLN